MIFAVASTLFCLCDTTQQAAVSAQVQGCQPLTRDPTMGYLKLNLASQSLRLSISILPRPCDHCQLSCLAHRAALSSFGLGVAGRFIVRCPQHKMPTNLAGCSSMPSASAYSTRETHQTCSRQKAAYLQVVIAVSCVCRDQSKCPGTLMPCKRIHAIRTIKFRPCNRGNVPQ